MKNIQPHIILGKLLKNKLSIDDYGLYHYGNVNEIKAVMRESSVKTKLYPLIWCELPLTNPVQSPVGLTANLKVFLATRSQKGWLNDERQIETFEKVLNPLYDKFCDILKKSDSFQVIDRQINRNDLPNFYTSEIGTMDNKEKNQVEEYWDVVTLDFRAIVMGGKCEVEPVTPVNTDITLDFDYEDLGNNEYRLFWSTQNAYRVYLNNEIVSNNGEKFVTVNDEEKGTFTLFAYNKDYKTAFETIIIDNTSVDPRVTYANRIGEDGSSIVGFDLLEDEINTPVGRKEGKLYAYNEDDYSVIANGERFEFTRNDGYKSVGIDVPRFDWTNGKQELLVEGQATNLVEFSWDYSNNYWNKNDSTVELSGFNYLNKPTYKYTQDLNGFCRLTLQKNFTDTDIYTISFIVKDSYSSRYPSIFLGTTKNVRFDMDNNTVTSENNATGAIEELSNGFKQISMTFNGVIGSQILYLRLLDVNNSLAYGESIEVSNSQLEEGAEATSPILTNGSIVTRPADFITNSQGQLAPGRYDTV